MTNLRPERCSQAPAGIHLFPLALTQSFLAVSETIWASLPSIVHCMRSTAVSSQQSQFLNESIGSFYPIMFSFTNSECDSRMSQKAFKAVLNKISGSFDSNAPFLALFQYNAFSLQCKDIWASAPRSAEARIPLLFLCLPRFWGDVKDK